MILVAGATGVVGSEVCRLLKDAEKSVRALTRSTAAKDTVRALEKLGVETVQGDVRDHASLVQACKGVEAVISTVSALPTRYEAGSNDIANVDRDGVRRLVDVARTIGVRHFAYISFATDLVHPLRDAKRDVERHLSESGTTYTILRPTYIMETWLTPFVGFDYPNGSIRLYGTGENPVSFISFRDVAHYAVASLANPSAKNATVEIGGPEAIAPLRVVEIFEKALGRKLAVEKVSEEALQAQQEEATDPMQQSFAGLMRGLAVGSAVEMGETSKRFGIRATSVEEYASEVSAAMKVTS